MEKIAFKMQLHSGQAAEYRNRHDPIWPDLAGALREAGISDYSIWLDPETQTLFATLTRTDDHSMDSLPDREVMQRWWQFMSDIMETDTDSSPVVVPLEKMFEFD